MSRSRQALTNTTAGQGVQGTHRLNTQTLMNRRGTGGEREEGGVSAQSNPQAGAKDNSLGVVPYLKAAHCSFASGCEK